MSQPIPPVTAKAVKTPQPATPTAGAVVNPFDGEPFGLGENSAGVLILMARFVCSEPVHKIKPDGSHGKIDLFVSSGGWQFPPILLPDHRVIRGNWMFGTPSGF